MEKYPTAFKPVYIQLALTALIYVYKIILVIFSPNYDMYILLAILDLYNIWSLSHIGRSINDNTNVIWLILGLQINNLGL